MPAVSAVLLASVNSVNLPPGSGRGRSTCNKHGGNGELVVFSGREFAFTIGYMLSQIRLSSVCRLSVTLVHPTQAVEIFRNFFSPYDSSGTLVF